MASRIVLTLAALLSTLVIHTVPMTVQAEGPLSGEPLTEHGVDRVLVSADFQRTMLNDRLEAARSRRSALLAADADAAGDGADERRSDIRAALAAVDAEIGALSDRLAADDFADFYIDMPYVVLRADDNDDGVAFSKFTYAGTGPPGPVGVTQMDPTQIVVWGEATHDNLIDGLGMYTRLPREAYRWENDDGVQGSCGIESQYAAMRNAAPPAPGNWEWTKSTGRQPIGDQCLATDDRHHLRFFASSNNRIDDDPLGPDDEDAFGDWVVIAAHFEEGGAGHAVTSWDEGEARVVDSFRTPAGNDGLNWVESIERHHFFNSMADSGGPQGVPHDGVGYLIEIGTPAEATAAAPSRPAPTLTVDGNSIVVTKPAGAEWFDYFYRPYQQGSWTKVHDQAGPTATITGLEHTTEYEIVVRSLNARGVSDWSDAESGRVTTGSGSPCENGTVIPDLATNPNPGLVQDCEILLAAKDQLAGSAELNWKSALAIDDWDGVTTGGTPKRATRLNLSRKGLNGIIPAGLGDLEQLEWLWLLDNALTGPIPEELGSLSELVFLYLQENDLTGTIPAALGDLTNLRFLGLNKNWLTGTIPAAFASLDALTDLYLDNNGLTGPLPPALLSMDRLLYVYLEHNQLSGPIPAELVDLDLRGLYLEGNQISGCIPHALQDVVGNDLDTLRDTLDLFYCQPVVSISPPEDPLGGPIGIAPGLSFTEGDALTFTLTRTGSTRAALTVTVNVIETSALENASMVRQPAPEMATFGEGNATTALTVNTDNDCTNEDDVTVTVTVLDGADYRSHGTNHSAAVTVEDDDGSTSPTDARLCEFGLSGVTLNPSFSAETTDYSASVAYSLARTTVSAVPNSSEASVADRPRRCRRRNAGPPGRPCSGRDDHDHGDGHRRGYGDDACLHRSRHASGQSVRAAGHHQLHCGRQRQPDGELHVGRFGPLLREPEPASGKQRAWHVHERRDGRRGVVSVLFRRTTARSLVQAAGPDLHLPRRPALQQRWRHAADRRPAPNLR